MSQCAIGPLARDGNTLHSYVLGKDRIIDVRPGDTVQHPKGRWKVIGVKAWRETYLSRRAARARGRYLVRKRYANTECGVTTNRSHQGGYADRLREMRLHRAAHRRSPWA
jgi:hypothetical protein